MNDSEEFITEIFRDRFDLRLEKIPETHKQPRPDFICHSTNIPLFVCELKQLLKGDITEENGWHTVESGSTMYSKKDNGPRKVSRIVVDAAKQLVNYEKKLPRVLVLLNKDVFLDYKDLKEAYSGYLDYSSEDGKVHRNIVSKKIAFGHFIEYKDKIDLYFWIDLKDNHTFCLSTSKKGHEIYQKYLRNK